jgi:hypothetical protein
VTTTPEPRRSSGELWVAVGWANVWLDADNAAVRIQDLEIWRRLAKS